MKKWVKEGYVDRGEVEEDDERPEQLVGEFSVEEDAEEALSSCQKAVGNVT